ncbi:carboxypeptidase-like regulatory domain-containing protein [Streptomyces mirabilis]|uniref:carboxypeptidase-like regulatory domain-containing protein n=1 Tax=Streptomyces mirabilis TaxID=68239 RepID=UPI0036996DA2
MLRGTVRSSTPDGRPVSEARVTLLDPAGDVVGIALTAEDGSYAFTGLESRPPSSLRDTRPGPHPSPWMRPDRTPLI